MIGKKSKHVASPINIICLAYLGIPEELKHLNIIIILVVLDIGIQKCKKWLER